MENDCKFVVNLNREPGRIVLEVLLTIPGFQPYTGGGDAEKAFTADAAELSRFIAAADAQPSVPSEVRAFLTFLKHWMDITRQGKPDGITHKRYDANTDPAPTVQDVGRGS
jgi:hypothetical protein